MGIQSTKQSLEIIERCHLQWPHDIQPFNLRFNTNKVLPKYIELFAGLHNTWISTPAAISSSCLSHSVSRAWERRQRILMWGWEEKEIEKRWRKMPAELHQVPNVFPPPLIVQQLFTKHTTWFFTYLIHKTSLCRCLAEVKYNRLCHKRPTSTRAEAAAAQNFHTAKEPLPHLFLPASLCLHPKESYAAALAARSAHGHKCTPIQQASIPGIEPATWQSRSGIKGTSGWGWPQNLP